MPYYEGKEISELNYLKKKHGHSVSKISYRDKLQNLKIKTERQLELINKEIGKVKKWDRSNKKINFKKNEDLE